MREVQLLYAINVLSRRAEGFEQELDLTILVHNLAYDKLIEAHWTGEQGLWQVLKAEYLYTRGDGQELWRAAATFRMPARGSLPGNIRFALCYRIPGKEFWDNNETRDYFIEADTGIMVREGLTLLNTGFSPFLQRGQESCSVSVAVHRSLRPRRVSVIWSVDGWKTISLIRCFTEKDFWYRARRSNAGNPDKYGWETWTARIEIRDAYRIEYAIFCDTMDGQRIWDNNFGRNYLARRESLKILTLNLHCYQEDSQEDKFARIAGAISDLNIDVVCFQEVGENWSKGRGDWKSNAARIIRERLKRFHHVSYHLHTDWSHIGFGRYREGSAILSKYKFLAKDAGYVSDSRDIHDIHARKVVMVQVHVPYMGLINVFSVHLSWWSDGFQEQFDNLRKWAGRKHTEGLAATLLCGDFNIEAGSRGYAYVAGTKEYEDKFLEIVSAKVFNKIFRQSFRDWNGYFADDHRIDYIFMKKDGNLKVTSARELFTGYDYGRVSDHCGYLMEFEPR